MKLKRVISALLSAVCLAAGNSFPVSADSEKSDDHVTKVNGTFIQPWLYATYDDERWDAEMQAMKEIGIEYLIMGDVANHNTDGTWTVYYPSEIDYLKDYYVYDALGDLLYYCDKYDIRLYLGMGLDCAWNSDIASEEGRKANREYMTKCNEITTELYNKYKAQYPDTYYGFYFVTELYNTIYMDTDTGIDAYADGLDEMFTMVIDNCNALDPEMPLLFSPYVNIFGYGYASINSDRFTEYYTEVLSRIPFRDGDMICPQDSCGAGGCNNYHLEEWIASYRNAVNRSNEIRGTELLLGTNAEMFISPDASRMNNPHGVSYVGTKTVDEFTESLEIAEPYVDSLFCFAYPHHYSPHNSMPEFHENFIKYLKTGEIETTPPTPPTVIKTEIVIAENSPRLKLTFYNMMDNTAVAQTNIYKNGKFYDYLVAGVNMSGSGSNTTQNTWIDYEFDTENETAVYEFECIDVCGNISEKTSYTVTPQNTENFVSESSKPNVEQAVEWNKTSLDYLTYAISGNSIRISGCDESAEEIVIPDIIEGHPVTIIDWYAFENCSELKSVVIPETVTHISRFAFAHCISLETVNMPESLYAVEQYAFFDCPKLKGINLPENLSVIEQRAFCGCESITEVIIPESCKTVGEYAFLNCNSLSDITVEGTETVFGQRSVGYGYNNGYVIKNDFCMDTSAGTAVDYAKENGIRLKTGIIRGDVNADGKFNVADAVVLQKWLLGVSDIKIADWQAGNLHNDNILDVFDFCLMKKELTLKIK